MRNSYNPPQQAQPISAYIAVSPKNGKPAGPVGRQINLNTGDMSTEGKVLGYGQKFATRTNHARRSPQIATGQ